MIKKSRYEKLNKGSLTIEAAITLPLFLFALVCVMYLIEYARISVITSRVMYSEGTKIASQAYPLKELGSVEASSIIGEGTSILKDVYIASKIEGEVKKVSFGGGLVDGNVNTSGSKILKDNGDIKICVNYRLKTPFSLFNVPPIKVKKQALFHGWVGYEKDKDKDDDDIYVYITDAGTVYHLSPSCSHIELSISQVPVPMIEMLRNNGGAKYYPCEKCMKNSIGGIGNVYITKTGTRYHSNIGCSELKRGIKKVKKSEVGGRPLCKRCEELYQ